MADIDDIFTDPNGPAYQKREERTGPPLEYVAEKIRNSLISLHHLSAAIDQYVPAALLAPDTVAGE